MIIIKKNSGVTGLKKQLLNIGFLAILVGLTFYIILSANKDFNFGDFVSYLAGLNHYYVIAAFFFLAMYVVFQTWSLQIILKRLGHKKSFYQSLIYTSSDIYYSAITPSASGGQPASIYYMNKDGVPVYFATALVTFNTMMYIASLMIIAAMVFIISPGLFFEFSLISKILIISGIVIQFILMIFFILMLRNHNIVQSVVAFFINLLAKLHIFKHPEEHLEKLEVSIESYKECIVLIKQNKSLTLIALFLNFMQRMSQSAIAVCVYFALGVNVGNGLEVLMLQSYCLIASNSVPLPGAVGVSEGLYLDAFKNMMSKNTLLNSMMATRGISYYICFILTGALTLIHHARLSIKSKK